MTKMKMTIRRTVFFSLLIFVLIFGVLETVSYFLISSFAETGTFSNGQINSIFHPYRGWETPKNAKIKTSKLFFEYPNETFVETDEHGRAITPLQSKNPDIKIAILGGSSVFGVGSTSNATNIPSQIESKLNNKYKIKAEVTNLAVRGYNSFQELVTLHEFLLNNKVDIVIAVSGYNDARFGLDNDDIKYSLIQREVFDVSVPLVRKAQRQEPIVLNLEGYFRSFSYFIDIGFRILYRVIGQPNSPVERQNYIDIDNIPQRVKISIRNYQMMKKLAETTGAYFIFALQPSAYSWSKFPGNVSYMKNRIEGEKINQIYMNRFAELLSKSSESLNLIDLRSLMNDMMTSPYVDSTHYTDGGAEKIADFFSNHVQALVKTIIEN